MPVDNCHIYFTCAGCDTLQRVYNGDPEDMTRPDVDAVKCYKCGVVERFDDGPDADPEFSVEGEPLEQ